MTNEDSHDADDHRNRTDDRQLIDGETIHELLVPLFLRASAISVRILWVTGRAIALGILLAVAVLTDSRNRNSARRWVLLEGNRWTIAGGVVALVFAGSMVLSYTNVIGVSESSFVTTMFSTIIAGLFSLVPIVISVNQLTVSRLFATPGGLRERIDSVQEFRGDLEGMASDEPVSPTEPARFLERVIDVVSDRTARLQQATTDLDDPQLSERIEEYVATIRAQATEMDERFDGSNLPLIDVLVSMMGDSYSENVNVARRIQAVDSDTLPAGVEAALADLRELFVSLDVLRQYFKALYVQQELSNLSRLIAVTGTGALLMSMFLVMVFATGQALSYHPLVLRGLVSLGIATAVSPFAVLLAFMLRIATIVKRTSAPGAFTPRNERPDYVQ